jgi:hypothetical protein
MKRATFARERVLGWSGRTVVAGSDPCRQTEGAVPEPKEHLPPESDRLLEQVADLRRMEQTKRTEPISSDEFHRLAKDITRKSHDIMYAAREEEETGDRTSRSDVSIDDVAEQQQHAP